MRKISVTQFALLGGFLFFAVVGILAIALFRGGGVSEAERVRLTIWGVFPDLTFTILKDELGLVPEKYELTYRSVAPENFDTLFVQELAEGRAPDLVIMPHASIVTHASKLITIPYGTVPAQTFTSQYVDAARVLMTPTGVKALPIVIDPLVLFWNRTLLANEGYSVPPEHWASYKAAFTRDLTKKSATGTITQSAIALGEYDNVSHARQIISALLLQANNPISTHENGVLKSTLQQALGSVTSTENVMSFYKDFSNPLSPYYTWSSTLPSSREQFTGNRLAAYIAPASELYELQKQNPNISYDVALLPYDQGGNRKTYGTTYAVAIPKMSNNAAQAYQLANLISSAQGVQIVTNVTGLPPARRDLIQSGPVNTGDLYMQTLYNAAVQAGSWHEPGVTFADSLLRELVNSVVSGRQSVTEAVRRADDVLTRQLSGILWE